MRKQTMPPTRTPRIDRTARALILGLSLGAIALSADAARGQQIPGATAASENADPGQYLGNMFKDEQAGFRISPPLNSKVIKRSGVDLVSFVDAIRAWGGALQLVDLSNHDPKVVKKTPNLEDYGNNVVAELNKSETFKGVQVLEKRLTKFHGQNALRLTTSMEGDLGTGLGGTALGPAGAGRYTVNTVSLLRQQLIVEVHPSEFYVLTFYTPLKDKAEGIKTFEAVADSLEIYNPGEMKQQRINAINLGKAWLEKQTAEEFKARMIAQPQWFKVLIGGAAGTDVGATKFEDVEIADKPGLRLKSRNDFQGVQIQIYSWTFIDDKINTGENFAFWAYSKNAKGDAAPHYSMWTNLAKTLARLPNPKDKTRLEEKEFWRMESGFLTLEPSHLSADDIAQLRARREEMIRKNADPTKIPPPIPDLASQYHISVTLSGDAAQQINADEGVDLKIPSDAAAPLPKIFEYMWPRMIDVTKASEMSFVVYNSDPGVHALALRTLIVTGKKEFIPINGRQVECWKCVDELDPGSTTLWVERSGRIVSMRTSDQTLLLPTSAQEIQQRWGNKIPVQ